MLEVLFFCLGVLKVEGNLEEVLGLGISMEVGIWMGFIVFLILY